MASRKSSVDNLAADTSSLSKKAKQRVTKATFNKWQRQYEHNHQTMMWLHCDTAADLDKFLNIVESLWCGVCREYKTRIRGMKNFSKSWIDGSTNHKTSNILDHASSEQHKAANTHKCRDQAKASNMPVSPLAHCLLTLDSTTMDQMRKFTCL